MHFLIPPNPNSKKKKELTLKSNPVLNDLTEDMITYLTISWTFLPHKSHSYDLSTLQTSASNQLENVFSPFRK